MRILQHVFQAGPKGGRDLLPNRRKRGKTVLKKFASLTIGMMEQWNSGVVE